MVFRFRSAPSGGLVVFYGLLHLTAVAALAASTLPMSGLVLSITGLGLQATLLVRCALLKAGAALSAVEADATGTLLTLVNGRRIPVIVTDSYCSSWLQIVQFRRCSLNNKRSFWLIVLPDTTDADSRRQLRAWLLASPMQSAASTTQARD